MTLSTIITGSPVILFLGAGASVPLGKPVMKDFVAKLEAEITSEEEASLLSVLISARGYDLEAIMTDLETFISLNYVSTFVFDGVDATLGDADKLRALIRHSVIREYRAIDTTKVVEVYRPLFDTIFLHVDSKASCLPIFTTNYDLAIEEFCKKQYPYQLVDGLDDSRDATWNQGEFERFRLYSEALNWFFLSFTDR